MEALVRGPILEKSLGGGEQKTYNLKKQGPIILFKLTLFGALL